MTEKNQKKATEIKGFGPRESKRPEANDEFGKSCSNNLKSRSERFFSRMNCFGKRGEGGEGRKRGAKLERGQRLREARGWVGN